MQGIFMGTTVKQCHCGEGRNPLELQVISAEVYPRTALRADPGAGTNPSLYEL